MNEQLLDLLVDRLDAAGLPQEVENLLLAACEGQEALNSACGGTPATRPPRPNATTKAVEAEPLGAYLTSLTVEGFRGIGPAVTLNVTPGPGLTVVAGRNGSGKSSLAEAFEILLTGENLRWTGRNKVWEEGWRNLHHPQTTEIRADIAVEGVHGATTVTRSWPPDQPLSASVLNIKNATGASTDFDGLGWTGALSTYRPFLSYNELGSTLEGGPSALYDTLSRVLGLEDLTEASSRLAAARLARDKQLKAVKKQVEALLPRLRSLDDERATKATDAIAGKSWDLDDLELTLLSTDEEDAGSDLASLQRLTAITPPDTEQARQAAAALRQAAAEAAAIADTDAGQARDLARLLQAALDHHAKHDTTDCPVCGATSRLDDSWRQATTAQAERLHQAAAAAASAEQALQQARTAATRLITEPPSTLATAAVLGIDASAAIAAWGAFARPASTDDEGLAAHLEAAPGALAPLVEALRDAATKHLESRNDAWRPLALELATLLSAAREVEGADATIKSLKKAEDWLTAASADIRTDRFQPIADRTHAIWHLLRQQSNVEIGSIELEGAKNRRRVTLDVTVDGVDGAALGVMSQGELHALALSLFLPRATLAESPFRFLVLDDPVQAMDPARVDGLARVLADIAKTRQVIVLTHDDRLPEAIRRMAIAATVVDVRRREGSVVDVHPSSTPAEQALQDAFAIAKTEELPPVAAARIVPGLCRLAIEAACVEVVRRRRIGRGEPHAEVEQLLTDNLKLNPRMALLLFDDPTKGGDVYQTMANKFGQSKVDAYKRVNAGAHQGDAGNLVGLARNVEGLVGDILAMS
jgi:DNA repair exonuclease SbcCD ATPase subunit